MANVVSNSDYHIRDEARPGDADAVERITGTTGFFSAEELRIARELIDNRLDQGEESEYRFVFVEDGDQVIAYACYGHIPCTDACYDLYWIVVDPAFQARGVGKLLLAETERRIVAAEGRRIYVDTAGRAQYEPTRAFYRDAGYEVAAVLNDFYAPGDDKVIFVRNPADS